MIAVFLRVFCLMCLDFFVVQTQTDETGDGVGRIEIDRVKEEERRIVLKEASGGKAFSITYQKDYPNSADEYLVRQTDRCCGT